MTFVSTTHPQSVALVRRAARRRRTYGRRRPSTNRRTGGFLEIEKKFLDSELTATANGATTWVRLDPSTGPTDCLSVPAQGDGESDRDGRVYYIDSIHIRGYVQNVEIESATGPFVAQSASIALVWDTQSNAAALTATDVMDGGGTDDFLAFRNLQNSKRFIILKHKIFNLEPKTLNSTGANAFDKTENRIHFTMNKKFKKPIKCRCVGTTSDIASASDNSLHLIGVGSNAATIEFAYQCRVRFHD